MIFPRSIMRYGLAPAACVCSSLRQAQPDFPINATPVAPSAPDVAIARALKATQPANIELTIKTLVGFGTRSTLSSMDAGLPPGEGINARAIAFEM